MLGQIDCRELYSVMLNEQQIAIERGGLEGVVNTPFHGSEVLWMLPVIAVDLEADNMISEVSHVVHATGIMRAVDIGRPHEGRILANDVGNGSLGLEHLLHALLRGYGVHIWMRPAVGRNLMTSIVQHANESGRLVVLIKLSSAICIAGDEERCVRVGVAEDLLESEVVDGGTVVEGESNCAWLGAMIDQGAIGNVAKLLTLVLVEEKTFRPGIRVTTSIVALAGLWDSAIVDSSALKCIRNGQ